MSHSVGAPGVYFVFRDEELRQTSRRPGIGTSAAPRQCLSDALYQEHRELLQPLVDFVAARSIARGGRAGTFGNRTRVPYSYTCALTGYRVTTISSGGIVDAAHIHQFADSRNNDPQNGIALCKNAHWQFDVGLWSIAEDYRVLVASDAFAESSPNQRPLSEMHGQKLHLPQDKAIWPSQSYLAWHRTRMFQGAV